MYVCISSISRNEKGQSRIQAVFLLRKSDSVLSKGRVLTVFIYFKWFCLLGGGIDEIDVITLQEHRIRIKQEDTLFSEVKLKI